MKSPPNPESTKALAGMRRFPARIMTDRIKRESEEEEPVNVIDETGTEAIGGGVDGTSTI